MTAHRLNQCLVAIYAIFGKTAPAANSPTVQMLEKRTRDIPDELDEYIVDQFCTLKTLPQNMIDAFRGAYATWKLEHPGMTPEAACPVCKGVGGWTYYRQYPEGPREFFSFCPHCRKREGHICATPAVLRQSGLLVMDNEYPGGPVRFRADHGLAEIYGELK